jgi:WD40 repeat protein
VLSILQGHSNYIRAVSFSNDGKYLASGSGDNSLKLWIVDTFERKKERSEIPQEDSPSMLFPQ